MQQENPSSAIKLNRDLDFPPKSSHGNLHREHAIFQEKNFSDVADSANDTVEQKPPRPLRDSTRHLRGFAITDALALIIGFLSAWTVSVLISMNYFARKDMQGLTPDDITRVTQFLVLAGGVILWFERNGHYRIRMPFWLETRKIVEIMAFAMLINGFLQFASHQNFSRLWLMSSWVLAALICIILRSAWRSALRRRGHWRVPTLLVGKGVTADEARIALESEPGLGYEIVTQIEDLPLAFERANYSWSSLCATHDAEYVIIALDGHDLMLAKQPITQLIREPIPFSVSPPLHHLPILDMTPQYFFNHDVTLLTRNNGLDQPFPRFVKRSFDIIASTGTLIALSPLFLFLILLVRRDGGNAFYSHKRLGLNGKAFYCLKFRSMVPDGDAVLRRYLEENPQAQHEWQNERKLRHDPRITNIGALLRRTSLDELPQLINVLKGEMSIVGPRPIVVAETKKYNNEIVDYYRVRPGLTGLWQVSGRSNVSYGKRVSMDSWYVRNWSLWHDVMIICKTFPALLKRKGAY